MAEKDCLTGRIMDALICSDAVYYPTQEEVLRDLHQRFGHAAESLIDYGFEGNGKQAVFASRNPSGLAMVACRGTSGMSDIVQDLKYLHRKLPFAAGSAHWGFAERAQSIPIDFFLQLLEAGEELVFTGHSLGGAVASLLCLRLLEHNQGCFRRQLQCITFGAPLFASRKLAELINFKYRDAFVHLVSTRDCVPRILPLVSVLQRLLYSPVDHLEGLSLLGKGLEYLLPIQILIKFLEQRVPFYIKFFIRCFLKLALPSEMTGSYVFAGQILMLDTDSSSFRLKNAEDLNVWHSQLNYALGLGFDAYEHTMVSYQVKVSQAIARALPTYMKMKINSLSMRGCNATTTRLLADEFGSIQIKHVGCSDSEELSYKIFSMSISGNENDTLQIKGSFHENDALQMKRRFEKDVEAPKSLNIGWVIGVVGRIARHWRALENLCIFTLVRIVFVNVIG